MRHLFRRCTWFSLVLSVAATELPLVFSDIAIAAAPTIHQYTLVPATPVVPPAHAEFRGIWIATVDNTDWPSEAGLPVDKQKKELDFLLDQAVALHLNAILLQVRPSCDALYQSSIEPWSSFLTGAMGKPPAPFYDPLSFAIAESHKRGLELHAWVNPFRVRSKKNHSPPSADSVEVRHPEWVKHYGDVEWLDPGNPDARDYSLSVIHDIVQRYDIDGIHIDDYFYPYPQPESPKPEIPFPDQPTFEKYGAGKTLGDWRRNNIRLSARAADFCVGAIIRTNAGPSIENGGNCASRTHAIRWRVNRD